MPNLRARLAGAVVAGCVAVAPLAVATPAEAGPTRTYLVTLQGGQPGSAVATTAQGLASRFGGQVVSTYSHVLKGFAVRLPVAAAPLLAAAPGVASVRPDGVVRLAGEQVHPTWGLDRVDERRLPLDRRYVDPARAGAGAHVYVVDTGLNPSHSEFTGRVGASRNFIPGLLGLFGPDPDDWGDCNGHGTHVASTAAGTRWGVAKRATVHAARVLDCSGTGATSQIIAALDWIAATHQSPAVVNLSFGEGARSPELDAATRGLVRRGVSVVAAAGNGAANACGISPAGEPALLTVGATNVNDRRAEFSNYGSCVDLFAPGVAVTAADFLDVQGSIAQSGTSMAAPHVAGAVALLRSRRPDLSAAEAQTRIVAVATRGRVLQAGAGSPNRLLFVSGGDRPPRARFGVQCRGLSCTFDAGRSSDDKRIRGYRWQLGGAVRFGRELEWRFRRPGEYAVTLRVVDSGGQATELTKRVTARRG